MKSTVKLLLIALLLIYPPAAALAELSDQVQADFATMSGLVVMPINDEYIVDLDARDNLNIGDILTVVKPGKKIFHPETKEVIGSVDDAVGFLQVTRIYTGYSYARVLTDGLEPANGASVKRFEQVPARFVDATENGSELVRLVKLNLPQFRWLDEGASDATLLTFTLQADALEVATAQGDTLHRYEVTEDRQLVSATVPARPQVTTPSGPKPRILQQFANALMGTFGQTNEERFAEIDQAIIRQKQFDRKGIWMSPNMAGHPVGLAVADFDGDGHQEIAIALEDAIQISRVIDGEYIEVARVPRPTAIELLDIDAFDGDGNGLPELYVSALGASRAASFVVQYNGSDYQIVTRSVRWLLRVMTLPGETATALVGQSLSGSSAVFGEKNTIFSGPLFRVQREGDKLVEGEPVALPIELNLLNFSPLAEVSGQSGYAYLTADDYLKVMSAAGEQLWTSNTHFGGSETCFNLAKELRDETELPTCLPMSIVMLPGNEILVAQNEGQRLVKRYRKFQSSRVVSLTWNGFALTENWRTSTQSGYLGDFALADADNDGSSELVMVVKFQHKGMTVDARSSIVIYELN